MKKTLGKVLSILIVMSMLLSTMAFMSFATGTYEQIEVGVVGTVTLTEENPSVYVEFTPTESGYYVISSDNSNYSNCDPKVYIYDSYSSDWFAYDDDDGEGNNFSCGFNAEAGETYLIELTTYNGYVAAVYDYFLETVETPVSITAVGQRDLIENYSGYWNYDYNESTDAYDLEYFNYYISNADLIFTLTYSDGSQFIGDEDEVYNECGVYPSYYSSQSYDSQWDVGSNTIYVEIFDVVGTGTVKVVENPVKSVEAVAARDLVEYWNGYYTSDWIYIEDLGEWGYSEEYFYYDDVYDFNFFEYTITYKDGSVYTGDYWDIEEKTGYYPSVSSEQSYYNQWGVGSHDVEISFLGNTITVPVNVIECPVESITVNQGRDLIEGVHGYYATDSLYDEDDEYIGESDNYFYYYVGDAELEYIITYKDGTVITGESWEIEDETGEYIEYNHNQSYETPFEVGYNDITVSFMGYETTAKVKVAESPLDYVIMDDITIIENADGYWEREQYYDEDLGEWVYTDEYFHYYFYPSYTAVMKDGTKYESDSYGVIKYNDYWISIDYDTDQSFDTSWGLGEHEVTGYFMGQEVEFTVEVVETPIENMTLTPERNLAFGIDDEYGYTEYLDFTAEIEFKDGSTNECLVSDLYREYGYVLMFDEAEFVSDYVSAGTFSFMGYDGEFEVTFIDNPYESITISGLNELKISFNKEDGTSDVGTMLDYDWHQGDWGSAFGYIITDIGTFPGGISYAYSYDEDETNISSYDAEPIYAAEYPYKDVTVYIGEMESNTLATNNWYWALSTSKSSFNNISFCGSFSEYYYNHEFTGLDIEKSIYNLIDLSLIAVFEHWHKYEYDFDNDEENWYIIFDADDVVDMIEKTFAITGVNITKHPGYHSEDNTVWMYEWGYGDSDNTGIYIDYTVEYVDGKWYATKEMYSCYTDKTTYTNIVLNDEMLIERVTFGNVERNGWVLEDGKWAYFESGIKATNRWIKDSVGWCYVGADGYCVTNCWKADSKGWCYLDANGRMVYNKWVKDNGKWYFMDSNGYMVSNCWKKDSTGWCYLGSSGAMLTNAWVKDSVGWCYVGADGYCVTNKWVKDSVGWCYLDANGRMATNKWIKDSVGWCYVGANGYCVTNDWVKDSKGWCYLDANGRMVYNNWVKDGGKWYYLDSNGYMVTGTKVINGKTYKFASNGVWLG